MPAIPAIPAGRDGVKGDGVNEGARPPPAPPAPAVKPPAPAKPGATPGRELPGAENAGGGLRVGVNEDVTAGTDDIVAMLVRFQGVE